jgi:hypothetical protein
MVGNCSNNLTLLGYIADHYGAKVLANTMALTCWLGLALVLRQPKRVSINCFT